MFCCCWALIYHAAEIFLIGGRENFWNGRGFRQMWPSRLVRTWQHCLPQRSWKRQRKWRRTQCKHLGKCNLQRKEGIRWKGRLLSKLVEKNQEELLHETGGKNVWIIKWWRKTEKELSLRNQQRRWLNFFKYKHTYVLNALSPSKTEQKTYL